MTDEALIRLYWQRDPAALAESQRKYGHYCQAIAGNILSSREDAEECVNDTWLSAWNAIPPHRPTHLRGFLAKLVRNHALNRYNAQTAAKRGGGELSLVLEELSECLGGGTDPEALCSAQELGQAVNRFVRGLPAREGNVFLRRCFFTEPVSDIARRYGMSENHVMVMLSRTRKKLRAYLIKEGLIYGS